MANQAFPLQLGGRSEMVRLESYVAAVDERLRLEAQRLVRRQAHRDQFRADLAEGIRHGYGVIFDPDRITDDLLNDAFEVTIGDNSPRSDDGELLDQDPSRSADAGGEPKKITARYAPFELWDDSEYRRLTISTGRLEGAITHQALVRVAALRAWTNDDRLDDLSPEQERRVGDLLGECERFGLVDAAWIDFAIDLALKPSQGAPTLPHYVATADLPPDAYADEDSAALRYAAAAMHPLLTRVVRAIEAQGVSREIIGTRLRKLESRSGEVNLWAVTASLSGLSPDERLTMPLRPLQDTTGERQNRWRPPTPRQTALPESQRGPAL